MLEKNSYVGLIIFFFFFFSVFYMCVEKHEEGISIEYQKNHNMICVEKEAIFTPVFEGGSFI